VLKTKAKSNKAGVADTWSLGVSNGNKTVKQEH